jgi:hypothetical protein
LKLGFRTKDFAFGLVGSLVLRSEFVRSRLFDAGEVASFQDFVGTHFGRRSFYLSRNSLRSELVQFLNEGRCFVFEFGVAQGETARWLSSKVDNPSFTYFGFDTFTGLPEDWFRHGVRYRPSGFFDNGGEAPNLQDPRFYFRKGLIEESLPVLLNDVKSVGKKVFLFDFDLYKPTKFAWKHIQEYIGSGDYIYFDEAFDSEHERRLIAEELLPRKNEFEYVGNTTISLLLRKR